MAEFVIQHGGRRCGRTMQARLAEAMRQQKAALDKHASLLRAGDVQMQQHDLAAWIGHCEAASREGLAHSIRFARGAIESARLAYGRDAHATRYVDLRSPFLDYAEAAMARRFSIDAAVSTEVPSDAASD